MVAAFSQRDVEEFYAIKSILEGYAARKACDNLTAKELDKLTAINQKLHHLAEAGDIKNFFKVHNDFHDLFIKAANNDKLYEMVNGLVKKFQRLRVASLSKKGRMQVSVEEHEKIIEAFRNKNANLAEKLVQKNAEYGGIVLIKSGPDATPMKKAEQTAAKHLDL